MSKGTMIKHLKTLGMYALILAAGLGVGVGVAKVPSLLKKDYVQGDYSAYYAQHKSKVVLYGTETCPYCAKAREYFKQNKIAYVDLDVSKPGAAQQEFKNFGGSGVPMLLIGDRRINGFIPKVIEEALKTQTN